MADLKFLQRVKRVAVIALFSDDELMDKLVLKGGNLLDIVYEVSARASVDVDFSTPGEFDLAELKTRVENALVSTFAEQRFVAFDISVQEKPEKISEDMKGFWGGYEVFFKIIDFDGHTRFGGRLEDIRRNAANIGKDGATRFCIQISKFEYCEGKERHELDGYTIYGYSPKLLVCEKIRAICQQMPEYQAIVHSHPSARARDFVDIDVVSRHFRIAFDSSDFKETITVVFAAKRVPLRLIGKIGETREFHAVGFPGLRDTVKENVVLEEFDAYVDRLVVNCRSLESLWNE